MQDLHGDNVIRTVLGSHPAGQLPFKHTVTLNLMPIQINSIDDFGSNWSLPFF
jgi:hypothetical protein